MGVGLLFFLSFINLFLCVKVLLENSFGPTSIQQSPLQFRIVVSLSGPHLEICSTSFSGTPQNNQKICVFSKFS